PKTACEQCEAAFALHVKSRGRYAPETLRCVQNLANCYSALGRSTEALKLREETLAHMKAKLGADHRHTLIAMNNLSNSYAALGRREDAVKLCEETLQLRRASLGADECRITVGQIVHGDQRV